MLLQKHLQENDILLQVCCRLYARGHVTANALEVGNGSMYSIIDSLHNGELISQILNVGLYDDILVANWVKFHVTSFGPGMFVVSYVEEANGLPPFGKIKYVLLLDGIVQLVIDVCILIIIFFSYCVEVDKATPPINKVVEPKHLLVSSHIKEKCPASKTIKMYLL